MTGDLLDWGWWSKAPGSANEYGLIAAGAGGAGPKLLREEIAALQPGQPDELSRSAALPWATFSATPAGAAVIHRACWWDWTRAADAGNRRIMAGLIVRLTTDRPVSRQGLARYVRQAWQGYLRDGSIAAPDLDSLTVDPLGKLLPDPAMIRWAAAAAALTLCGPVRIAPDAGDDPESVARLFDAIIAMLPGPARAMMQLATLTPTAGNGLFNIAVGRRPQPPAAYLDRREPPNLTKAPVAADYYTTICDLLEHRTVEAVSAFLDGIADMPDMLGPTAATHAARRLAAMDQLFTVGRRLQRGQPVDLAVVRDLVQGQRLAANLPEDIHLAYVARLLEAGDPADLPLIAANWTGDALDVLIDVLAARTTGGDRQWVDACDQVVLTAGADQALPAMLDRAPDTTAGAVLVCRLLGQATNLDRTRQRLLADEHQATAQKVVHADPGRAIPWLAAPSDAPGWTQLLLDTVHGKPRSGPVVRTTAWVVSAIQIAMDRDRPVQIILADLLRDLVAAIANDANGALGAWLEDLTGLSPAARADADFVLLVGGILPPGIRHGSSYAADVDYQRALSALLHGDLAPAGTVDRLIDMLAGPDATEDGILTIRMLDQHAKVKTATMLQHVRRLARARPSLIAGVGAGFREQILGDDRGLRRAVALVDVDRLAATGGPAPEFADAIVTATRLRCDRQRLGAAVAGWARGDIRQLQPLCLHLGKQRSGGDRWDQLQAGMDLLSDLLDRTGQQALAAGFRDEVLAYLAGIDAQLTDLLTERERAATLERRTRPPGGQAPAAPAALRQRSRLSRLFGGAPKPPKPRSRRADPDDPPDPPGRELPRHPEPGSSR